MSHEEPDRTDGSSAMPSGVADWDHLDPALREVLASAALLQRYLPDAVLVGGSAAAMYAGHRASYDHDHVLVDLSDTYVAVMDALEACPGWVINTRVSKPPMTLMGAIDAIEAGVRQLRRTSPLETTTLDLPDGTGRLTVPTVAETLRIKAFLIVQRNQVRDYLDVAALAAHLGVERAARLLLEIDDYYTDRSRETDAVSTSLVERLSAPEPRDSRVIGQLAAYRGLDARWHDWRNVVGTCADLAASMLEQGAGRWS